MRASGRIFLRGEWYSVAYFVRGVEMREPAHTKDAKQAEKFLKTRMDEVGADRIGARKFVSPKQSRVTIGELIAAVRAKFELDGKLSPQNVSELKKLDEDFGKVRATELTPEMVDNYKKELVAQKYALATINRRLIFLTRCYTLAIKRGDLNSKPSIELFPIGTSNARQGFLSDPDFRKVHKHLPDDLKDFCLYAFLTSWRKGEVSCLKWSYLQNGVLRIPAKETKNGEARSVVIAGELAELIARREKAKAFKNPDGTLQPSDYIFHRGDGVRITEFRKSWGSACRKSGLAGRIFHDLRRSGVRNMIRAGVPQSVAMKISGHKTTSMFRRYDIGDDDDLKAAAESVTRYNAAVSASAASNVVAINANK
jgi:integrase